jgi:hypothetical protein
MVVDEPPKVKERLNAQQRIATANARTEDTLVTHLPKWSGDYSE